MLAPLYLWSLATDVSIGSLREQFWHTGPIITGPAMTKRPGHVTVLQEIEYSHRTRYTNNWKADKTNLLKRVDFSLYGVTGITSWMDVIVRPRWQWNDRKGVTTWVLADTRVQFDFQLFRDQLPSTTWLPSMRLVVRETCPTGKYQHLNPKKLRTDRGGNGVWETTIGLNIGKIFYFGGHQFLNVLYNIHGSFGAPTHVHGFNTYGGGYGTNGTVYPERKLRMSFAMEYPLTQSWIIAIDSEGYWWSKTRFSGKNGVTAAGTPASNTRFSSIQYSLAPSIEYVWSKNLGIYLGSWFTVAGKNSPRFRTMTFAFLYSG